LYLAIRASEPGLSLATVYNTLEALTSAGLCRRIPSSSGSGACRYDADVSPHAHVLLDDGRVVDVPAELGKEMLEGIPGELLERIEARLGVKLEDVSVTLHAAGSDDASDAD
jgi:Fe2+ or Zn2+ uptake regulation protein